jgi:uncharacterized membrane protein YgcG
MSTRRVLGILEFAICLILAGTLLAPAQAQQSTASLSKAQLEQLVAPIALHPDPLLSQMLMASTYPTEVVQAARWAKENPGVSGVALEDAMQKQPWDPSVKALTAVPQTLQMMSDKLDWTQQLGDAFLGQQEDLLAAVQRLRERAQSAGNLKSTEQQTVKTVQAPAGAGPATSPGAPTATGSTSRIVIEPTNPDYLYMPVYDPRVVYGDWPYPDYEPYYWYPAGWTGGGVLAFATAVAVGSAIWGNVDWWRNRVDVNVNRFNQFNRTRIADNTWRHNAAHRGNVPYRDPRVAQRFGNANRAAAREAYRGKADAGRRDLAKGKVGDGAGKAKAAQGAAKAKAAQGAAKAKAAQGAGKGKAAQVGSGKAKSAAAGRAKQAAGNKSGARAKAAQNARGNAGHAARSKQAGNRPGAGGGHRPQMRGYGPPGGGRAAVRGGGGGHRIAARGGGGFRGGGGGFRGGGGGRRGGGRRR